jgi:hypothetical protein
VTQADYEGLLRQLVRDETTRRDRVPIGLGVIALGVGAFALIIAIHALTTARYGGLTGLKLHLRGGLVPDYPGSGLAGAGT